MSSIPHLAMRPFHAMSILAACTALAACGPVESAGDEPVMTEKEAAKLAERLEGLVASEPVKCVQASRLGQPIPYGNRTLLYRGSGRTTYVNKLPARCLGLDDDDIILTENFGSRMCEGDIIQPIERLSRSFVGPRCRLGKFTPYVKEKKPG